MSKLDFRSQCLICWWFLSEDPHPCPLWKVWPLWNVLPPLDFIMISLGSCHKNRRHTGKTMSWYFQEGKKQSDQLISLHETWNDKHGENKPMRNNSYRRKILKKMVKKGKEKKICGIIIIDETWKFSFRNQTKGLRCRTYSWITSFCFPPVFQTQTAWGLGGMQYEWGITQKWLRIKYVRIDVPHDPAFIATYKVWTIRFQRKLLLSSYV